MALAYERRCGWANTIRKWISERPLVLCDIRCFVWSANPETSESPMDRYFARGD